MVDAISLSYNINMCMRGRSPKRTKSLKWTADLAYAVGLLATDGSLSKDGRHISLVSKDLQQLENLANILHLNNSIGKTRSGSTGRTTTRIQFGDVVLYKFLIGIGLTPNKTKTIGMLRIPKKYFFDFLRGHFDGDGSSYSYFDTRYKSSFMFYISFVSASSKHISWLQSRIIEILGIRGHVSSSETSSVYSLRFAKKEGIRVVRKMYSGGGICLSRKRLKIEKSFAIMDELV